MEEIIMNGVLTQITAPKTIEDYMKKHDFIPADRYKVRQFLRNVRAVTAVITKKAKWESCCF